MVRPCAPGVGPVERVLVTALVQLLSPESLGPRSRVRRGRLIRGPYRPASEAEIELVLDRAEHARPVGTGRETTL